MTGALAAFAYDGVPKHADCPNGLNVKMAGRPLWCLIMNVVLGITLIMNYIGAA